MSKVIIRIVKDGNQITVHSEIDPIITERVLINCAFSQVRVNQHDKTLMAMKQSGNTTSIVNPHTGHPFVVDKEKAN